MKYVKIQTPPLANVLHEFTTRAEAAVRGAGEGGGGGREKRSALSLPDPRSGV